MILSLSIIMQYTLAAMHTSWTQHQRYNEFNNIYIARYVNNAIGARLIMSLAYIPVSKAKRVTEVPAELTPSIRTMYSLLASRL